MDLRTLHYFITVVEEGNISKAAKKLHISQPPLSLCLKNLEEELDVTLFMRGARYIELTEAGKILYQRALTMVTLETQAKKEMKDIAKGVLGTLSIGCVSSNHMYVLTHGLKNFMKEYPEVSFEVHEGNTYELLDLLEKNMIELAFVRTPFNVVKFNAIVLDEQPMIAVYHPDFFTIEQEQVTLKDLAKYPLMMYRRFNSIINSIMKKEGIDLNFYLKSDDARTALLWADNGLGVALVPLYALLYPHVSSLKFVPLIEKELQTSVTLAYKKNAYLSKPAQALIDIFTKNRFSN